MTEEELREKIKKNIEEGPPPRPTETKPGPFVTILRNMEVEYAKGGVEPTAKELTFRLAAVLDHVHWQEEKNAHEQIMQYAQILGVLEGYTP
jgi:hypothetical protein